MANIVVLNNSEEFIRFLDPDLCEMTETIEKDGLRTLQFTYYFQDMVEDKELFKIGNKLWVYGDSNLTDCLYVMNTSVTQDIYQNNSFNCEMEEVLVELNYAPVFTQNELSTQNGFTFSTANNNTEYSVLVDWNSLNYWFGEYFNIGVVQKCLSDYNAKIGISGTMNLMSLLRYIEEETGNIFVTRYEKDCLNNTIHRYLDFLNPINVSKPWVLNLEYDFLEVDNTNYVFDNDGNPIDDTYEDVYDPDDITIFEDYTPITNINPANIQFRVTNGIQVLGTDGLVYDPTSTSEPLTWNGSDIPEFVNNNQSCIISLRKEKNYLGLAVNEKVFATLEDSIVGDVDKTYTTTDNAVSSGNRRDDAVIPDDSYFELYDTSKEMVVFRTCINREIGHVHEEILDFGFNVDNIILEVDETETYNAMAPVLVLEDDDGFTRDDMTKKINYWRNFAVEKGDQIPMIIEKITVQASSLAAAKTSLGTSNWTDNYWTRPYHPQDNIDTDTPANSTWEFLKGTAYWKAPFTKKAGDMHISTDTVGDTQYPTIKTRPDMRDPRGTSNSRPKTGNSETTAETVFEIYNVLANKLREHQYPDFNIKVDVANLRGYEYNQYQLHDKVYVKIPDIDELLTARVVQTTKVGHDVAQNTIELSNYSVQTVKQIQQNTFIEASNVSFKYPNTYNYTCRLVNMDYNNDDPNSTEYPANKLLTLQVYGYEDGMRTYAKKTYNKVTDSQGKVTIPLKYDPGDYDLVITFGGDEEYLDCSMSVLVNVSGTKTVQPTTKSAKTTKAKTTKKTANKDKKVTKKALDKKIKEVAQVSNAADSIFKKYEQAQNAAKKVLSKKERTIIGSPSPYVRKLALNIVGDSVGLAAAKKIVNYVDNHVRYDLYPNFCKTPDQVLKSGLANCCDQARTVLTLCDAAGCTDYLTLKYVHVQKSANCGHVFCKIITNSTGNWRYVDTCKYANKSWGNYVHGYGSPPGHQTTYPTKPFQN